MKLVTILFSTTLMTAPFLYAWKSPETKGEQPIFFGTLTTQEDNSFFVTNVTIGRSSTDFSKIVLYEKPKDLAPSEEGYLISVNPSEDLTTVILELQKIKKIEVPEPNIIWTWSNAESKRSVKMTYEYIELIVTWQSGSAVPYLLELGAQDTRRPVKIFCDVIDKQVTGIRQNGTLFCPGLKKTDLRKKGAPFQSIKELILEEPCYKVPSNGNNKVTNNNSTNAKD